MEKITEKKNTNRNQIKKTGRKLKVNEKLVIWYKTLYWYILGGMQGLQGMMKQFQQGAAGKMGNMFGK